MTFEKWMEEMTKHVATEMSFPGSHDPVIIPEKIKDYIDEDEPEE